MIASLGLPDMVLSKGEYVKSGAF